MFTKLTHLTRRYVDSHYVLPSLFVASLLESIIVPIPLETVMIPLMQKRRDRLWVIAAVALAGCLVGATIGYFVGYGLMQSIGETVVQNMGWQESMQRARESMRVNGFWFVLTVSVLPVPFQVAMLAAGATEYSFWLFMLATLISRGVRYFGLAMLVYWLGNDAEAWIKSHRWQTLAITLGLIVGGWLVFRYV